MIEPLRWGSPALAWLATCLLVLGVRRRAAPRRSVERVLPSWGGVGLHYVAIGAPFLMPRAASDADRVLLPLAFALGVAGLFLFRRSTRALGEAWSLEARLTPDHRLVRTGPYARVRHPVYGAVALLVAGTAAALASPPGALLAFAALGAGTVVRMRIEQRLLHARFGREYEEWARAVPALIPRRYSRSRSSARRVSRNSDASSTSAA